VKHRQSTLFYAHVHRGMVEAGAPLEQLVEDLNAKVRQHGGIILANRQFLRRPIQLDWDLGTYCTDDMTTPFEHPALAWDEAQRGYFGSLWGVLAPYQYAADHQHYDRYCIGGRDPSPYLERGEMIHALVEANNERKWIECLCHHTQAVYTSRHRVLCMGCGQMYCVLANPLPQPFATAISNERWDNALDEHGELTDDELEISIVDYRIIKDAEHIWTTDAWDEATWLLEFYREGTKEEIKRYEAALPTVDDFIAAGWSEIPTPPSIASQLAENGVEVDLWKNAEVAVKAAAKAFARSRTEPGELRDAVLHCFQAIELTLKMRLEQLDSTALKGNNPAILRSLGDHGIAISVAELASITQLRGLRNKLQHAGAAFAYRDTRKLLRASFAFLDRFTRDELDLWLNHACDQEGWRALLQIPAIAASAKHKASDLISLATGDPTVTSFSECEACGREFMVVFDSGFQNCVYCREEACRNTDDHHAGD